MTVTDKGEVEEEPQQQQAVAGIHDAVLQDDSKAVEMDEVLLQISELFMKSFTDSRVPVNWLGWVLVNHQVEAEE